MNGCFRKLCHRIASMGKLSKTGVYPHYPHFGVFSGRECRYKLIPSPTYRYPSPIFAKFARFARFAGFAGFARFAGFASVWAANQSATHTPLQSQCFARDFARNPLHPIGHAPPPKTSINSPSCCACSTSRLKPGFWNRRRLTIDFVPHDFARNPLRP